jgi:leader peptidase (prepilin peptidase)/N-methyltransferase
MIRILGTIFAGLLGLAFGSFLNVCLSRWPEGESVVSPRSHCRSCDHALSWWENVPLVSWLALRGRCRDCHAWIGWRYPLVEFAVGALWAGCFFRYTWPAILRGSEQAWWQAGIETIGFGLFFFVLVGLSALDAEHLWLPDAVTLPCIVLGVLFSVARAHVEIPADGLPRTTLQVLLGRSLSIVLAVFPVLLIRWIYWLIRHREGIGLGDAKLMALLAAWLGLPGALLAFGIGAVLGAGAALALLVTPTSEDSTERWSLRKVPLGTFLCVGGIVSGLWGQQIIAAYLLWAGL